MVVERRGRVIDGESGQLATGGARTQRKAAAFNRWHEPDESRGSSPDLWEARGEIPRAYSAFASDLKKPHGTATAASL